MTGSGTQADPFIVDKWADFRTIDTDSSGVYVRWADSENKVIDFNNIQPKGFSETIYFPANVDFNGWTLKNFCSTADVAISSNSGQIENLNFQNFYALTNSEEVTDYVFKYVNMTKCAMSGTIISNRAVFCEGNIMESSINLKADIKNAFFLVLSSSSQKKNYIKNSNIYVDISASEIKFATQGQSVMNSLFAGEINCNASVQLQGGVCNIYNLKSNRSFSYAGNGISIYNSDLAINKTSTSTFKACTTEQLKDPDYLYSLGFPVGEDND